MRRLGQPEAEPLRHEQERVEEAGGQDDVVVDEQQPVGAVGRVGGERRAQVGPLARSPGAPGSRCSATSWRERRELGRDRAADGRELGARDAGDVARGARGGSVRAARRTARACGASARRRRGRAPPGEQRAAAERAGRAREVVGMPSRAGAATGARARRALGERLAQPAGGLRGQTIPLPQRRRPVCQTQPASVRSSAASGGAVPFARVEAPRLAAAVPARRARARGCARRRRCGGGRRPRRRRSGSARRRRAAAAPTPPRRPAPSAPGRTARRGRARARRTARFAPQTSSASRSAGPRSSVVTGAGSRPHACRFVPSSRARIGPPNASCPGCASAAASSAPSHPGQAATSSSRKHSSSPPAAATAALRATLSPRGAPSAT